MRRRRNPSDRVLVAYETFQDIVLDQAADVWGEWMVARQRSASKRGVQKWPVVSAAKLIRVWNSYAKFGFVRKEVDVDDIAAQVIANAARLYANTTLMGHTSARSADFLSEAVGVDDETEAERLLDGFEDFCIAENGQWRISDLIDKIEALAVDIILADNAEDRLVAIDKLLNFTHRRTDAAASFVEGGSKTLAQLSEAKP